MAYITVEGIPDNVNKGRMSSLLKTLVFKDENFDFWVQRYRGNMYKKADLKFKTVEEAEKAKQMLHGFNLLYNLNIYPLSCYKLQVSPVYDYQANTPNGKSLDKQSKTKAFFNRERSRSPISNFENYDEITKVDKEIELIRKQRILVEEERKLLLEKKKYRILQNLNTSDIKELVLFESVADVATPDEIESVLTPTRKYDEKTIETLPGYARLNRIIFSQMKNVIKKHITQENSYKLRKLINNTIKQRLAVMLEGKTYVRLSSLLPHYRRKYPISSDENLLEELSKVIEQTDSHATANELQTQETTNDGQAESGENIDGENKKRKYEEPPELNEDVDMENDFDDWTDEEQDKPDAEGTQNSKLEEDYTIESVDPMERSPVAVEGTLACNEDVSQEMVGEDVSEEVIETVAETPEVETNNDVIEL